MKKIIFGLAAILSVISMTACGNKKVDPCENHVDLNHDGVCDVCETKVEVVHKDNNHNGKCDVCNAEMTVNHVDINHDGVCDKCQSLVDIVHEDKNHDGFCDGCGAKVIANHEDKNHDGLCDGCGAQVNVNHIDADKDQKCDVCGVALIEEIDWGSFGWNESLAKLYYNKLGIVIPYIQSVSYEYNSEVDIFGDNVVNTYLFYSSEEKAESAFNLYFNHCGEVGYTMELGGLNIDAESYCDGVGYADYVIKDNLAVEIIFLVSKRNNKPCLGIFATNYLYVPENEYPQLAVEKALRDQAYLVPRAEYEGATYNFHQDYLTDDEGNLSALYLEVHVNKSDYDIVETFFNDLILSNQNDIYYESEEDGEDVYAEEYPGFIPGQEYWCYHFDINPKTNDFELTMSIQFGYEFGNQYYDPFFYFVIYYNFA